MNGWLGCANSMAERWASGMWSVLWQSAVLAGVVFLATRVWRRAPASARFWLWMLVPLRLLAMPILTVNLPVLPAPSAAPVAASSTVPAAATSPPVADAVPVATGEVATPSPGPLELAANPASAPPSLWLWLMAAWLTGAAFFLFRLAKGWLQAHRSATGARELEGQAVAEAVRRASAAVSLRRLPRVLVAEESVPPFVSGMVRPVVVLPAKLIQQVSAEELCAVVAHEFAHVRRHEAVLGWVVGLCEVFYFFHPFFHLAKKHLLFERECACDDWVVASGSAGRGAYARALVVAAEACAANHRNPGPAVAVAESFHDLKRRLTLLGSAEKRSVRLSRAAVCALLLLTAVAIPGIGLAARPANAAAPAVASAGISCEQEIKIPASERLPASVSRGLWYISGNKMRMDTTKNPTGKGPLGFVIYRWDLGKVYFINPEKLVALEAPLPVDAIKEAQEKARQEVEVTKTDETRKIGEYLCTRYDLTLNGRTEHYWVTSVGDVGPELDTLWDRISPKAVKVAEEAKKQMPHPFPVLRESVGRLSGGTVTDTFSNLRKLEIQDSMFEVPAGYRTVPMPRTSSELREQMEAVETAPSEARIPGSEAAAARTLRFLAAAQNTFVVRCFVDQDGDGHGEYGALRELCGSAVPRGRKEALVAGEVFLGVLGKVTAKDFATAMGKVNNMGIVTKGGYCCIVYLPTHAGPAISEDAGDGPVADPSNAEPQETRWCAYAWPKEYGVTGRRVFVINWQAEVNVASNQRPDGRPLYSGDGTNAGDVIPKPGAALIPNEGREQNLDGHLIPAGTRFQSTVVSSHKGSDGQEWSLPQR